MFDEHYLVLKGYGWMLKALSQQDALAVFSFLDANNTKMPRLAYRYAMEKMPSAQKKQLMA